jgi:UDP-GlcNAc:undecaprenyl-phosphate GlcNAc-1-phosphate transferase
LAFVSAVLWALIVCTVLSLGLTPAVRALCLRTGVVDRPGPRSVHVRPVATLGGLALFAAFTVGFWRIEWGHLQGDSAGLVLGGAATVLVGLVDDLAKAGRLRLGRLGDAEGRGLRPLVKMTGQLAAATAAVAMGVRIDYVHNPFTGGYVDLGLWGSLGTVAWIFCVSTVINLIDGLDGLAAGVVAIASGALLLTALEMGQLVAVPAAVLSAMVLGTSLGFLPWNWSPASIIMGDTGALFLGYALAAVSVEGTLKGPTAIALSVPLMALGLPVFDTGFAIFRRWRNRRPIGAADRDHLHHRLLALGWSQRDTVIVIYIVTGWLAISALALNHLGWLPAGLLLAFIVGSLWFLGRRAGVLTPAGAMEVAATKPAGRKR